MFSALKSSFNAVAGIDKLPAGAGDKSFYELKAELPGGKVLDFAQFKDKVVLIINTASKCGYTPQYTGLEKLYEDFHAKGLEVVGFPSNEFAGQDPGTDEDIAQFCQLNHGVTFPLAKKSQVNGEHQNEVFAWLKANAAKNGASGAEGSSAIRWNFTKFLVDRSGNVVHRYGPSTVPKDIASDIEIHLLKEDAK